MAIEDDLKKIIKIAVNSEWWGCYNCPLEPNPDCQQDCEKALFEHFETGINGINDKLGKIMFAAKQGLIVDDSFMDNLFMEYDEKRISWDDFEDKIDNEIKRVITEIYDGKDNIFPF